MNEMAVLVEARTDWTNLLLAKYGAKMCGLLKVKRIGFNKSLEISTLRTVFETNILFKEKWKFLTWLMKLMHSAFGNESLLKALKMNFLTPVWVYFILSVIIGMISDIRVWAFCLEGLGAFLRCGLSGCNNLWWYIYMVTHCNITWGLYHFWNMEG